jgi:ABC-2 type transport system permease protein
MSAEIAQRAAQFGQRLAAHARFFLDAVKLNLQITLEYRGPFISQVFGMLLNDVMWVTFWVLYFGRFPVLNGWRIEDVLTIWAITGAGFGLGMGFFGNVQQLPRIIAQGELDYYLALPKNVLLHVLISKMDLPALGDILFGFGLFAAFLHPTPERILLFVVLALCGAMVFLGFFIVLGSLAFWMGNTEGLAMQVFNGLVTLSTYPTPLFHGVVKLLMFTVVPAWFVSHLPTALLQQFDWGSFLIEIGFAAGLLALAVWLFYRGLRRYESGSLMVLRS